VILPPKHVRDTHVRVVDRIAKDKCGGPVSTPDYEVAMSSDKKLCGPCTKSTNSIRCPRGTRTVWSARYPRALFLPLLA